MSDIDIDFSGIIGAFFGLLATLASFITMIYFTICKNKYRNYRKALRYFGCIFLISLAAFLIFPLSDEYKIPRVLLKLDDIIFPFLSLGVFLIGYKQAYGKIKTIK